MPKRFEDRTDAGRQSAERLMHCGKSVLVLGLPRGGLAVDKLGAPAS